MAVTTLKPMATLFNVLDEHYLVQGVHHAHAALARGEVVIVPTDTVYGLAVSPRVPGAVDRVVALKGRGSDMAPPILVSGVEQVGPLVAEGALTDRVMTLLQQFWPGALTVVLPVNKKLGLDIGHTPGTIAVRAPDQKALLDLLRLHGPLAVTSANLTGQPPCRSVFSAINLFGDGVSVYLDAGSESYTDHLPSTIVDATALSKRGGDLVVIRQGAVSVEVLQDAGFSVVAP